MDMSFALTYWLLANEYWQISRIMPFVIREALVPAAMVKFDNVVNGVMIGLIVAVTIAEGISVFFIWYIELTKQSEYATTWQVANAVI